MNYNRRSTRPDGLFYRDQRKLSPSRRSRNQKSINAGVIVLILLVIAVGWWMLRR